MTTNYKGDVVGVNAITTSQAAGGPECCMCGDCGVSSELFQCQVCQFRSQHRYCSNLYPKEESYQVCNWCISHDTKEKSQNSSNSSSSNKTNNNNNSSEDDSRKKNNNSTSSGENNYNSQSGVKKQQRGNNNNNHHLQIGSINSPIKKQRSPERSSPILTRKRIITNGRFQEKLLRRTRSEDITNNNTINNHHNNNNNNNNNNLGITKQVFRNRVRRYKLLDEVSS